MPHSPGPNARPLFAVCPSVLTARAVTERSKSTVNVIASQRQRVEGDGASGETLLYYLTSRVCWRLGTASSCHNCGTPEERRRVRPGGVGPDAGLVIRLSAGWNVAGRHSVVGWPPPPR